MPHRGDFHQGTESKWLHTILEAKLAKRSIGENPVRVRVSQAIFNDIEAECEAIWHDNPRRLYDMEVLVDPDAWFDVDTDAIPDLSGYSWG